MKVQVLVFLALACCCFSAGAARADDNVRSRKSRGFYLSALNGDPKSSTVGLNLAYNLLSWMRVTAGVGTEGTYGAGFKLMIPANWHLTFIIGYNYSHLGGNARRTSLDAFGSPTHGNDYFYPTHGLDWQFDNGFMVGVGVLFINVGYFF